MSKEKIIVNFHYGTEDFKKLLLRLVNTKMQDHKLLIRNIDKQCYNEYITQLPFTDEE